MRTTEVAEKQKAEYLELKKAVRNYDYGAEHPGLNSSDMVRKMQLEDINRNMLFTVGENIHENGKLTSDDISALSQANALLYGFQIPVVLPTIQDKELQSNYVNTVKLMNSLVRDSLSIFDEVTSQHLIEWHSNRVDTKEKDGKIYTESLWSTNKHMLSNIRRYFEAYDSRDLMSDMQDPYIQPLFSLYNYMEGIEDTHRTPDGEVVARRTSGETPDIEEVRKVRNQLESFRMFCESGFTARFTPLWDLTAVCQGDTLETEELGIDTVRERTLDRVLDIYSERVAECIKLDPYYQPVELFGKDHTKRNLELCAEYSVTSFSDVYMKKLDSIAKNFDKIKDGKRKLPDVSGIETADVEDSCEFE